MLDLFAVGAAAFITKSVAADGWSNWLVGLMLVGVYALVAIAFPCVNQG